jgi:hypothetical protein
MPPLVDQVAFDDSPLFSYFACLLIAKAQLVYLTEGDGKALFDDLQPLAIEAAQNLVDDISTVGDSFLTRSQIAELKQRAEDFAARYPIQGRDFSVQRIPTAVVRAEVVNSLGWLLSLPLAPFTALQGVDSGADAIHDFNRTAQQFVVLARQLPERLRGQMELFVYDLEDRDTVERTVDALDRAATSSERVAATVEGLPEEIRKALLDSKQPVEAVAKVVEQANALAAPLATTATQIQEASAHWLAILGPNDPRPPDPNKHPFDVRDWQAAATSIGDAAGQLRGLATDVETVQGSNALSAVIDRAFWRSVAFAVICFALALVYRVVSVRVGTPRSS